MSWPFKHLMGQKDSSLGLANVNDNNIYNASNGADSNKGEDANNNNSNHSESLLGRKQQEFNIHRLLQQQQQQQQQLLQHPYNHLDESGQQLLGSTTNSGAIAKPMDAANLLAIDHMLPAADQVHWTAAMATASATDYAHLPAMYSSFGTTSDAIGGYQQQQQQQVDAASIDNKPANVIDRFGEVDSGAQSSSLSTFRSSSHHQDDPIGSGRNLNYHQQPGRLQLSGASDMFADGGNHQRLAMYHRHQAANEFLAMAAAAAAASAAQQPHHHHANSYHANAYQSTYQAAPTANGRGGAGGSSSASTSFSQQQQSRQTYGSGGAANGPMKRRNKLPFFTGTNQAPSDIVGGKDIYGQPLNSTGESSERFSRKVFVGGLPPDIDEEEIKASFRRFGSLLVDWPHKAESKSYFPPKGYAFLLFHEESSVQALIDACLQDEDKLYLCVSSPTIQDKPVQIRPWRLSDSDYVLDSTLALDPRKTVFVGGVPRPLKASELANIMNNLYGGVCYAGIDTDPELKYPKGAGRVAFSNHQSYIAAISARFVHLQHSELEKRVEVKPYVLDDQFCDECQGARCANKFAPFFCANITCLQYYCETCWSAIHSQPDRAFHKPLVKEGAERPRNLSGAGAGNFRWC